MDYKANICGSVCLSEPSNILKENNKNSTDELNSIQPTSTREPTLNFVLSILGEPSKNATFYKNNKIVQFIFTFMVIKVKIKKTSEVLRASE